MLSWLVGFCPAHNGWGWTCRQKHMDWMKQDLLQYASCLMERCVWKQKHLRSESWKKLKHGMQTALQKGAGTRNHAHSLILKGLQQQLALDWLWINILNARSFPFSIWKSLLRAQNLTKSKCSCRGGACNQLPFQLSGKNVTQKNSIYIVHSISRIGSAKTIFAKQSSQYSCLPSAAGRYSQGWLCIGHLRFPPQNFFQEVPPRNWEKLCGESWCNLK